MAQYKQSKRALLEKILLPLILVTATIILSRTEFFSGLDNEFYDSQLRLWSHTPPSDITIIAIDERSLAQLGRWPWPRRTHAELINKLSQVNVKAIGLNILLTEPDQKDSSGDALLAKAIRNNGRVILPLTYGEMSNHGLTEFLPLPIFTTEAAGLGHVSFPLDGDGLVRGQFLFAGIGDPYWPAYSLKLLSVAEPAFVTPKREQTFFPAQQEMSRYAWQADQWGLIPFVGKPGTIKHVSYADVLSGKVPVASFANKIVLIGVTAPGLGDAITTPLSASTQPMSGVEINANALNALHQNTIIKSFTPIATAILSGFFVIGAILSYYFLSPRQALFAGAATLLLTIATSTLLLRITHLWFPPSSALLILVISYPIWSWRRLELTTRELFQEQKRAAVTLNAIADAVITTDAHGQIKYLNPVAETLTGFKNKEACGKPFAHIFQVVKENNLTPTSFPIERCLETGNRVLLQDSNLLLSRQGETFHVHATASPIKDHQNKISGIAIAFSDISELRLMTEKIRYQATHDALTQLPNRLLLRDRLQHAIARSSRKQHQLAVLFLDLDDFKKVNDSLGHTAGDLLLTSVVKRVNNVNRKQDTVARLGGDEFVLLLEDIPSEEMVAHVAKKTLQALEEPFYVQDREFTISGSIGISLFPKDGDNPETLLKNADTAMYRAKDNGRNNYQFYTEDMNIQVMKRMNMEQDLRRALTKGELKLYYQLQVSAKNKNIVGLECLLRWHQPTGRVIPPNEFITLAEETGLILSIGNWVIQTVCTHAQQWIHEGINLPRISINLSPRQFMQSNLTSYVNKTLDEHQLDPKYLGIEITESSIMQDITSAIEILAAFKHMGLHLSIDDFGTGYSSLSYLKQFPVDQLKIDQSFVTNILTEPEDAAISEAIIAMAHSMKLSVIAEGVETQAQAEFLTQCGCNEMQGYHFGRPLSHQDTTTLLKQTLTG